MCRARVLRGLDADWMAFPAEADPVRLSVLGELQALFGGRRTYELYGHPPELDFRDLDRIRGRPPDVALVLPAHVCGAAPLDSLPDPERKDITGAPDF